MKIKTSIAVDRALSKKADKLSRRHRNRSEVVEAALRAYVARLSRQEKKARDLEVINRRADDLNQEALDVLDYQVAL
ncbi:MAG: type II toxin-antitoxin system VapB family antitoxin [Acidobacteria bacterium]|nr:type II toxin-antitoxin system VapB family antitoxin [Acidobacteriota bacterium]